ncbi:MAG: bifunctional riboflavin kinase/FAD synthetase [Clostridia bacterium]|nr:bifunctional riboflavin kinase/FAD synthetase [Clostridia bacterium]
MKILRNPTHTGPCVLVLGMFDGVHRGHQALLLEGLRLKEKLGLPLHVCTFEPHPLAVIRPELAPPMLTTLPERAQVMATFGVDALCVTTFTKQRADETPEAFMQDMAEIYQPAAVVCGYNFTFGQKGAGNGDTLKEGGAKYGWETVVVPEFTWHGQQVCSTRIRSLLHDGDVTTAAKLLGHFYTMSGKVVSGRQFGHELGFPTANITIPKGKVIPENGVYVTMLETKDGMRRSVTNVGLHPTLPGGGVTIEAHVLGDCPDLYGQQARVYFLKFVRAERQFESAEQLRQRIEADTVEAKAYFAELYGE